MIQVRNVPDALHRELVRRARGEGLSLTAYIQRILEREVALPPRSEVLDRLMSLEPVKSPIPIGDLIREERPRGRE
ncbi:MAG TPA: hypothetical protein VLA43_19235, partial [Longimicrobiales bacterium]|nr:hypothetical protein [Longimicrobiales bacterium]